MSNTIALEKMLTTLKHGKVVNRMEMDANFADWINTNYIEDDDGCVSKKYILDGLSKCRDLSHINLSELQRLFKQYYPHISYDCNLKCNDSKGAFRGITALAVPVNDKKSSNRRTKTSSSSSKKAKSTLDDKNLQLIANLVELANNRKAKAASRRRVIVDDSDSDSDTDSDSDEYSDSDSDEYSDDAEFEDTDSEESDDELQTVENEESESDDELDCEEYVRQKRRTRKEKENMEVEETENGEVLHQINSTIETLKTMQSNTPTDVGARCIKACSNEISRYEHTKRVKNMRNFNSLLGRDREPVKWVQHYFRDSISVARQMEINSELNKINKISNTDVPFLITLLEHKMPVEYRTIILDKHVELGDLDGGEYAKLNHWINTCIKIPFGTYRVLPVHLSDGKEACSKFMNRAYEVLNEAVYGLEDAKMQIMQMTGQLIANPEAVGSAVAIHGPPGTGKTSLVKNGISKILDRPFEFIALGGAADSSHLDGHSYTYEGSTWGKIVQTLINSNCMNPVIYFDELDKLSDTPRGKEIESLLTHITDTTQNDQFQDNYFCEFKLDLSKCLFIFSYNDESKVCPILKDRMYKIATKGYSPAQKLIIGTKYMLPKICNQIKFTTDEVTIPKETLDYIIAHKCGKEEGVRNLNRCIEIIYSKLNLHRLMEPGSALLEKDVPLQIAFPCTVTTKIADALIGHDASNNFAALNMMYV